MFTVGMGLIGATAIFLGIDGKPAAVFAIADPVKATTAEALKALAEEGKIGVVQVSRAIKLYGINPDKPNPTTV